MYTITLNRTSIVGVVMFFCIVFSVVVVISGLYLNVRFFFSIHPS